jgi:hypothetical protein
MSVLAEADIRSKKRDVRFTPEADMVQRDRHVRLVPQEDVDPAYSITSSVADQHAPARRTDVPFTLKVDAFLRFHVLARPARFVYLTIAFCPEA